MEHPSPLQSSPWRTTALVASAVAAVELLLLVLLGAALVVRPLLSDGSPRAAAAGLAAPGGSGKAAKAETAAALAPAPKLARDATSVIVLNGNGSQGAASEKAALVQTRGYLITGTANAPRSDFARSVVMFRPGYRGEAHRLADDFGVKRVAPLDGLRARDLQGAHVALIVGEK